MNAVITSPPRLLVGGQGEGLPRQGADVFAPDRLIDAAANIGISVRMSAMPSHDPGSSSASA